MNEFNLVYRLMELSFVSKFNIAEELGINLGTYKTAKEPDTTTSLIMQAKKKGLLTKLETKVKEKIARIK